MTLYHVTCNDINQLSLFHFILFADQVEMISVAFLVILFSLQRYGTSKVGLLVGPALFIWFCSLGAMGIYNLVTYDSSVLKAFNPVHIYYFFERNSTKAWYALGGCLLCATGKQGFWKFRSYGSGNLFFCGFMGKWGVTLDLGFPLAEPRCLLVSIVLLVCLIDLVLFFFTSCFSKIWEQHMEVVLLNKFWSSLAY